MVNLCCIVGCSSRAGKKTGLRFFRFPLADKERCDKWVAAVKRKDWSPTQHTRICSKHFTTGEPHSSTLHRDYIPNIFPDVYKARRVSDTDDHRFQRRQKRQQAKDSNDSSKASNKIKANIRAAMEETHTRGEEVFLEPVGHITAEKETQTDQVTTSAELGTQTYQTTLETCGTQTSELSSSTGSRDIEAQRTKQPQFGVSIIEGNDKATSFYTGLTTWALFFHLFMFLSPFATSVTTALSMDNQLFMVLTRLRLNLLYEDLAHRFDISMGTVSNIIDAWLNIMYARLKFLIAWPSKEITQHNMPDTYRKLYPNCRCIIDCSEVFIETPLNFDARSRTYSNYKKHNTIKFLIAITPCGSISFLSKCWGGRVSDKILTQESGFLNLLEPGDTVLADRGFTIADDIALFRAKLEIPPFTRGKKQLAQRDVETSQQLSRVRIHVERVIGLMKSKFTILKGPLPVSMLKHSDDVNFATIDKVLTVCGALTNLCKKIV